MSNCGCEGSCPVCRIGEVDDHKCNRCGTEFCSKCHGITKEINLAYSHPGMKRNVSPCKCKENKAIKREKGEIK